MLFSLIIPVFNAERTIPASLDSIKGQMTDDIEIVFVDDGSTDNSLDLISDFLKNKGIKGQVIHQFNSGVAAARNTGLDAAHGEYLLFMDADDKLCDGAISSISNAIDSSVDIVGWDWLNEDTGKVRHVRQANYDTPSEALFNMMSGIMKWNLWLFAVRRSLIVKHGIRFLPGANMGEDMMFMLKAVSCASKVKQLHSPLYRYNASNPSSISNSMDEIRRAEVSENLASATAFIMSSSYSDIAKDLIPHLKLYIKRPLLISSSKEDYSTWFEWFPESNVYAGKNKSLPLRIRILQVLAAKRLFFGVKVYNYIVYGIIGRFFYH